MLIQSWRHKVSLHCEPLEERALLNGGHLLIADYNANCVRRYDEATGAFVDVFVPEGSGGINQPWGVLYGPNDRNLYVSTGEFGPPSKVKAALRYNGTTGAFIDHFTTDRSLKSPRGIIFGPDGDLFIADRVIPFPDGRVLRYDGRTGAYEGEFVTQGSGGLAVPGQLVFAPSVEDPGRLDLYVASIATASILRYHGESGEFLGPFVTSATGGLRGPVTMTFGPNGNLYVSDFYTGDLAVKRFQGPAGPNPGAFIDTFIPAGSGGLRAPSGLVFGPDGNDDGQFDLYLADVDEDDFDKASVLRYDGLTGAFLDTFVVQGSGGLVGAVMIAFTNTDPVTLAYNGSGPAPAPIPPLILVHIASQRVHPTQSMAGWPKFGPGIVLQAFDSGDTNAEQWDTDASSTSPLVLRRFHCDTTCLVGLDDTLQP